VINGSDNVAAVGSCTIGHCQAELNSDFCTSPIVTAGSTVARDAESLGWPVMAGLGVPQALTLYAKFIELGTRYSVNGRLIHIGPSGSDNGPRLLIYRPSNYSVFHQNASGGSSVTSSTGGLPTLGDITEVRATMSASGSVQIGFALNGADEAGVGAASADLLPLASSWGTSPKIFLNSTPVPNTYGSNGFILVRVAPGVRTMEEMRRI
jgi:hypothetical protein